MSLADLVDLTALARWGARTGLTGPISDVRHVGGGTQNVVLRLTWGGRDLVLRRPPEHPRPTSDATMAREIRVLSALAGTEVPHPGFVAGCTDADVLGVVFYLMDAVDGDNPGASVGELYRTDPAARRAAALDTASALARLAAVDHEAIGLGDLGRPDGFLERQVPRWLDHLASYDRTPGYPGHRLPHVDELAGWLRAHRPQQSRTGLVHGDYHLNNVLLDPARPRVAAIVDWEMCTVGDPLLDLGWLLVTWPDRPDPLAGAALAAHGGLPDVAELVETYARDSDRDLSAIDWYTVLAGFKLAIVIEGTYARAHAGQADPETGRHLHEVAVNRLEHVAALAAL
ncbi:MULTISPECIES: phosphotransferase family protein [Pseudonocardia]|uniref:Phosphotransferase enzyme family protein n=2 Tax=Pseudonocardia TaxID=1847 RepID=A0A1Y2N6M9_PSEAH|nr:MULTISPECIES: phosphotransferase family protein [Pseudonocardia]OSY42829.1 Phosphotransferase enzyme family protein [Pseudonocardia autotrophica]TDN77406.1 aminoglycoside phosphotransferase (APT) family kinase protein [Pseudonocardia autotrophica]BBG01430.1 putative aminoglycoside phosphotransferase [Pseudonocardia autotrophica]GEC24487.1 putative aminoglycoside phosphotransferase [Pseudonocardia saturnea]